MFLRKFTNYLRKSARRICENLREESAKICEKYLREYFFQTAQKYKMKYFMLVFLQLFWPGFAVLFY